MSQSLRGKKNIWTRRTLTTPREGYLTTRATSTTTSKYVCTGHSLGTYCTYSVHTVWMLCISHIFQHNSVGFSKDAGDALLHELRIRWRNTSRAQEKFRALENGNQETVHTCGDAVYHSKTRWTFRALRVFVLDTIHSLFPPHGSRFHSIVFAPNTCSICIILHIFASCFTHTLLSAYFTRIEPIPHILCIFVSYSQ